MNAPLPGTIACHAQRIVVYEGVEKHSSKSFQHQNRSRRNSSRRFSSGPGEPSDINGWRDIWHGRYAMRRWLEQLRPSRPSRRADQVHQTRLCGRLRLAAGRRIIALGDKRSTIHHDDVEPSVFFMDIKCAAHSRVRPTRPARPMHPQFSVGRRMRGIAARLRLLGKKCTGFKKPLAGASARFSFRTFPLDFFRIGNRPFSQIQIT
jgi:hypothetical protein